MTHIGLWVAAYMLVAAASPVQAGSAPRPMRLPDGGTVRLGQRGPATTVIAQLRGRIVRVVLPREEGIYAGSLSDTTLVGAIRSTVAVISADYGSNPAGGSYQCGAGTETVVRVIALLPRPHQTFAQRVASGWSVIDAGEISWNAVKSTLTIDRTTYAPPATVGSDATAQDSRTTYRVMPNGTVTVLGVERLP